MRLHSSRLTPSLRAASAPQTSGAAILALILAFLAAPSAACVSQLAPVAPTAAMPLTQMPAEMEVEPSTVQLIVPLDFNELNRLLNESLPQEFAALQNISMGSGLTASFRLARAGNLTLLATQGRMQVILPLALNIEATWSTRVFGYPVGHTERASVQFVLAVDTRLSANESWQATSESTVDFQIAQSDVGIGPVRFDVRRLLDNQLRPYITALRDVIDQQLGESIDLRGRMQRLWPRMLQPIAVMDDPALYMQLEPVEVQWVRPRMEAGRFTFGLGVAARVRTYMGAPPEPRVAPPLPALREVETMGNGFHLFVPLQIPFVQLAAEARARLAGTERLLDSGATVRIETVDVRGAADGRVHIRCGIVARKGILHSAQGTLHMVGVPRYNPQTRVLRFEEVDYDLDTRNVLLRMASWAMHDDFLAGVQAALEFEVGENIDEAVVLINESARDLVVSDQLTLHVQVDSVGIGPILVSDDAIVIVGLAEGTVGADVSLFGRALPTQPSDTRQ